MALATDIDRESAVDHPSVEDVRSAIRRASASLAVEGLVCTAKDDDLTFRYLRGELTQEQFETLALAQADEEANLRRRSR
jgi:hypothetical protein